MNAIFSQIINLFSPVKGINITGLSTIVHEALNEDHHYTHVDNRGGREYVPKKEVVIERVYGKMTKANKSGVVGVRQKETGKWVATICIQGVTRSLYYGDSYDDAVSARQDFLKENNTRYPVTRAREKKYVGITRLAKGNSDVVRYKAIGNSGGVRYYLYTGSSLEVAIKARRDWEIEHGLHGKAVPRIIRTKPTKKNKSGVRGVSFSQGIWRASATVDGKQIILYRGKNFESAKKARLAWVKVNMTEKQLLKEGGSK